MKLIIIRGNNVTRETREDARIYNCHERIDFLNEEEMRSSYRVRMRPFYAGGQLTV